MASIADQVALARALAGKLVVRRDVRNGGRPRRLEKRRSRNRQRHDRVSHPNLVGALDER
jgi:hypothetical protein